MPLFIKCLDLILIGKCRFHFSILKRLASAFLNKKYIALKNMEVNILILTNICIYTYIYVALLLIESIYLILT